MSTRSTPLGLCQISWPLTRPTRTAAIGPSNGMSEMATEADAATAEVESSQAEASASPQTVTEEAASE